MIYILYICWFSDGGCVGGPRAQDAFDTMQECEVEAMEMNTWPLFDVVLSGVAYCERMGSR